MATPGLRVDQVADAVGVRSGSIVEMLNVSPTTDRDSTSSTFVDINAEIADTFEIPTTGEYEIVFTQGCIAITANVDAVFRLVFDAGETYEQTTPDNNTWKAGLAVGARSNTTHVYKLTLAAGSHTVKVQWKLTSGAGTMRADVNTGFNVWGSLSTGSGLGGIIGPYTATLSADRTIVASTLSPIPTETLTVDFNTVQDEIVELGLFLKAISNGANATVWCGLFVDGVQKTAAYYVIPTSAWTDVQNLTWPVKLDAGAHTVELRAAYASSQWNLLAATQILVTQYRGGVQQEENVPILEYNTAAAINVTNQPSRSTRLRCVLNDGREYIADADLAMSLAVSGLGGLEAGSEASSTWYYVYAVPDTVSGFFNVVASVNEPSPGGDDGPANYAIWKYLGCIRNDSSSNILKFYQYGDRINYDQRHQPASSVSMGTTEQTKANQSLADYIPETANLALFDHFFRHIGSGSYVGWQKIYVKGASDTFSQLYVTSLWSSDSRSLELPIPDLSQSFDYESVDDDPSGTIIANQMYWVVGWLDAFLKKGDY